MGYKQMAVRYWPDGWAKNKAQAVKETIYKKKEAVMDVNQGDFMKLIITGATVFG